MKDWVWNIFIMTTSLAFVELLLPEGDMRKYLKFVFSLFILATIIYPFSNKAFDKAIATETMNIHKLISVNTRQVEDIYREKMQTLEKNKNPNQNPGISLPPADIYSKEETTKNER